MLSTELKTQIGHHKEFKADVSSVRWPIYVFNSVDNAKLLMKFSYSPSIFFLYSAQLEYVSEQSQLEFLQLLSDRARQRITYHCKNSVAWPEKSSNEGIKSIKMLTVNGLELHARSSNKFKPTLVGDDCAVSETQKKKKE